jgi:hypothetical protein
LTSASDAARIKFVRRQVRRNRQVTADEVVEAWRTSRGGALDDAEAARVRYVYEEEAAAERERLGRPRGGNFFLGAGLALLINIVVLIGLANLPFSPGSSTNFLLMVLIGLVQLVYLVPIGIWLRATGRTETLQGVIAAAAITLLLSGACFALLRTSLPGV